MRVSPSACRHGDGWTSSLPRVMSGGIPARQDRAMTCLLNLILDIPSKVLDVVLGPEEQIAYVSVTTRR